MIADRYYYLQLSEQERKVYRILYDGVINLEKEIPLKGILLSMDKINRVFHAITADNPYLYFFNQTMLDVHQVGAQMILVPRYFFSGDQIQTYNRRIEKIVNQMMTDLRLAGATDSEKVRRVHDYFCRTISYDYDALSANQFNKRVAAHSVIGVFAKQTAVCEGITKAVKLVLNTAGVKCIVVDGLGGLEEGEHCWNIVKVDGDTYHLDMTWDLANSKDGYINYDYYNLSDDDILRDHSDFHGVPACNSTAENYFVMNNVDFYSKKPLYKYIERGISKGQYDFYFRYRGPEGIASLLPKLVQFLAGELPRYDVHGRISSSMKESQGTARILIKWMV